MKCSDNFRILEGFETDMGVTNGFFARSACPNEPITEKRRKELLSMGFDTVLDLRRIEEVQLKKTGYEGFKYFNIPLINTRYRIKSEQPLRGEEYYNRCLTEKDNIVSIFKLLANSKNGVIYHCAGGKSRSGVLTILLLSLVGVNEDEIIKDYCHSYLELYDEEIYNQKAPLGEIDVRNFLKLIYDNFNNTEKFLEYIGVTSKDITKIKQLLVKDIKYLI